MLKRSHILASLLLVVSTGCKPPKPKTAAGESASLKTLDNFAAQKTVRQNRCEARPGDATRTQPAAARIVVDPELSTRFPDALPALRTTLGAVPDEVQAYFVEQFRGEIHLTEDANTVCTESFSDADSPLYVPETQRKAVAGCFRETEAATETTRPKLVVYLAPNAEAIRHNLVRVFGWMFTKIYAKRMPDGREAVSENEAFRKFMTGLTGNFLRDGLGYGIFSLKALEPILGPGMEAVVRSNQQKGLGDLLTNVVFRYDGEASNPPAEQRTLRLNRLYHWLFSEAYDSYYCRPFSEKDETEDAKKLDLLVELGKKDGGKEGPEFVKAREKTLQEVSNTRLIMEKLFPKTYCFFQLEGLPSFHALVTGEALPQGYMAPMCSKYKSVAESGAAPARAPKQGSSVDAEGLALFDINMLMGLFTQLQPLLAKAGGLKGLLGGLGGGGGGGGGGAPRPPAPRPQPQDNGGDDFGPPGGSFPGGGGG